MRKVTDAGLSRLSALGCAIYSTYSPTICRRVGFMARRLDQGGGITYFQPNRYAAQFTSVTRVMPEGPLTLNPFSRVHRAGRRALGSPVRLAGHDEHRPGDSGA